MDFNYLNQNNPRFYATRIPADDQQVVLMIQLTCVPRPSRKARIQAGWAGQAGAVTRFPSTCTLSNDSLAATGVPPDRLTSGPTAG